MNTFISEHMEEYIQLIMKLTSVPAPSFKEEKRAAFVLDLLKRTGYEQAYIDAAGNVVCIVEGRKPEKKIHMFAAHLDTVFSDEETIPVEIRDGRICGPGVGDDTTNVCALLMSMKYLAEHHMQPEHTTVFVFNTGEEGLGNLKGSRQIMKDFSDRLGQFVSFDLGYDKIYNVAVGSHRYRFTVTTGGGHSYNDFGNPSAIHLAAEMVHDFYQVDAFSMPGKTTYNVGVIEGGTSVNTIAQKAQFMYEYRSDNMEGLNMMHVKMTEIAEKYQARADMSLEMEMIGDRPSMGPVDAESMRKLTERSSRIITECTGKVPVCTSGSTDCNMPLSAGITAICFGTCLDMGPHTREEYVPLASLAPGLKIAIWFIQEDFNEI